MFKKGKLQSPDPWYIVKYDSGQGFFSLLNKQGPLDKQQRREAGSFVDQDQQYF